MLNRICYLAFCNLKTQSSNFLRLAQQKLVVVILVLFTKNCIVKLRSCFVFQNLYLHIFNFCFGSQAWLRTKTDWIFLSFSLFLALQLNQTLLSIRRPFLCPKSLSLHPWGFIQVMRINISIVNCGIMPSDLLHIQSYAFEVFCILYFENVLLSTWKHISLPACVPTHCFVRNGLKTGCKFITVCLDLFWILCFLCQT